MKMIKDHTRSEKIEVTKVEEEEGKAEERVAEKLVETMKKESTTKNQTSNQSTKIKKIKNQENSLQALEVVQAVNQKQESSRERRLESLLKMDLSSLENQNLKQENKNSSMTMNTETNITVIIPKRTFDWKKNHKKPPISKALYQNILCSQCFHFDGKLMSLSDHLRPRSWDFFKWGKRFVYL